MVVDVGNWPGLQSPPDASGGGSFVPGWTSGGCIANSDGTSTCTVHTLPAQVPIQGPSTAPSPFPVQSTGTPTPNTVGPDASMSTVLTSAGGILGEVETIISHPSQHIVGVFVLLVVGWFLFEGLKKL